MRKSNKEYLITLREEMSVKCEIAQEQNVSNDDYIDFINGQSISIYDIDEYFKEYANSETDLDFETYLVEECIKYVNGERELP